MTNRLAETKSLYLRKHAENPIDWWYWCDEALAKAKAENKPVFLSIGYSSCHWCTVMEGEAFSNQAIADYLNANFVPIKVDREERPDIDSIYMQALQLMTGQGGWPLNIFLTPDDLVPFYGGTYFPLSPRYNRPSFLDVLSAIRRFYDEEPERLEEIKEEIFTILDRSAKLPRVDLALDQSLLEKCIEACTGIVGRTSHGPSFPMIPYAAIALLGSRFTENTKYDGSAITKKRGLDLALGGIYDHVGGGFHRYTVDPNWTVPHFEKMLYDNGQITEFLANLWANGTTEPAFKTALEGTVAWLSREMTAPAGYFYAAQDADSFLDAGPGEPEEGAFYVWNFDELQTQLSAAAFQELQTHFFIEPDGNFEGKIVLKRRASTEISDHLQAALDQLFTERYGGDRRSLETFPPARDNDEAKHTDWPGRIPAVTDMKLIVAWNALMISGLARIYGVLGLEKAWDLAVNCTNFILKTQWQEGQLYRLNFGGEPDGIAQSEDYAFLIKALLDLQANNPTETHWLHQAIALQSEFDAKLWSVETKGYFNNTEATELLVQERSYQDNATPSANGVAVMNLMRLFLLTADLAYLDKAEQTLQAFTTVFDKSPQQAPSLIAALDWFRHCTLVKSDGDRLKALTQTYLQTTVLKPTAELPKDSIALVCQGLHCLAPSQTDEQLHHAITASMMRT
ncbi:thioredoxin domain-containing protein [[Limnothrix rosea] IAM M-220]|uniref:thioredoxin domain-containing protein n=1 Tax=[Limnothrix rosea] IAM M-220 TaxID=454133 RepID=UPI00096591DB|nr:thioredoxin domain-containing protein [[Limnothrix rosea] IAM M-220]OKH11069.1 thioredoxin domain-containing protein [[Limnothrix rosea] IAM M-220]